MWGGCDNDSGQKGMFFPSPPRVPPCPPLPPAKNLTVFSVCAASGSSKDKAVVLGIFSRRRRQRKPLPILLCTAQYASVNVP